MNWKRVVIILVVLLVLAAVAWAVFLRPADTPDDSASANSDVDTITVATEVDLVAAEGDVSPLQSAQLSFAQAGQVAELLVKEGDEVAEGDPLIHLDATDQEIAVQQALAGLAQAEASLSGAEAGLNMARSGRRMAELGVAAAEAQLDLAKAGASPEQIALGEQSVAAAQAGTSAAAGSQAAVLEGSTAAQLFAAEAELRAAEALQKRMQDALGNAKNNEKEIVQKQLNAATAGVSAAQSALNELQAGATQAERLAASAAVSQAIAQSDSAQAQLDLLVAGTREEQIRIAEVAVEQAMAVVAEADLTIEQAEKSVALAESGLLQAEAALSAAQLALDDMTLVAPFAGTVAKLAIEVGEVASPGVPVVTLADFSGWLVETTNLTERDVVSVAVGQPVEVKLPSRPDEVMTGSVSDIASLWRFENQERQEGDILYTVTILLDESGESPLRWGMNVFVDIDVE
jgi:HlyD family secretion protein